jgi:hypothetical protein
MILAGPISAHRHRGANLSLSRASCFAYPDPRGLKINRIWLSLEAQEPVDERSG